jgi:peptidyl-prolyl cis-trans isomerase SurA
MRAVIAYLLFCFFSGSVLAQTLAIDKVLAIVDDEAITMSEYQTRHLQQQFENQSLSKFDGSVIPEILEVMIDERIQEKQARLRGLTVSQREIDGAVEFVAKQNNLTVDDLIAQLESDNFTYDQFRDSLERQQLLRKLADAVANSRVVISDQEVEDYIRSHSELQNSDESYEVSHLFVQTDGKTEQQIESEKENLAFIRNAIVEGQPFADAVKKFGDGDNEDGGYMGWRQTNQLPELFIDALRNLEPDNNNISAVLQSPAGLHILKLHGRRGSGQLVRQQLVQHILIQPDESNTVEESAQKANEIFQQLQQGEAFEKLARLHSQDAQSRNDGGSLGWISPGTTLPRFENAATELPLNTVSKPVQTRYGFHLIKVLDRRETDIARAGAENKARQAIFVRKAADLYNNWFRNVRQRAFVEYIGTE